MARWTIRILRKCDPEKRLHIAAWLFWISIVLGAFCTFFVARDSFEKILMAISWGAITVTCIDVILTADVRDEASTSESDPDDQG